MVACPATKRQPKSQKPVVLYVPDYFTPQSHLSDGFKHLEEESWYILDLIRRRHIQERAPLDEYVGILAELLRLVIPARGLLPRVEAGVGEPKQPPDYKALLIDLQFNGAIDCDDHFDPGFKSTGYRLTPSLRGAYHGKRVTNPDLLARIKGYTDKEHKQVKHPIHIHLKRYASQIEIDGDAARRRIEQLSAKTNRNYSSEYLAVEAIERRETHFVVDDYGRRVHTQVSSLNKHLRPFLRFQGQTLVNHDIKNSQPFFLGLILLNLMAAQDKKANWYNMGGMGESLDELTQFSRFHLPAERKPFATFLPPIEPFPQRKKGEGEGEGGNASHILFTDPPSEHLEATPETTYGEIRKSLPYPHSLVSYLDDCRRGVLYEKLMAVTGFSRAKVKARLWKDVLFGKRTDICLAKAMHQLYPFVVNAVREMKKGTETDRHKLTSLLLQRQESALIIGKVATRLMLEHKHVPIWTIHDSILTTQEHSPLIQQVMRECFEAYGVQPSIQVEDYGK